MKPGLGRAVAALAVAAIVGCTNDAPLVPPVADENPLLADTLPPSQVTGLSVAYDRPLGRVLINWMAPHDNEPTEPVDRYEIRYSFTAGIVPHDYSELTKQIPDPPTPKDPGAAQTYVLQGLERRRDLFVAIRALDAADNASVPSNIATTYIPGLAIVGRCTEAGSGAPVAGLAVRLSGAQVHDVVTDTNGEYTQDDLNPGAVQISIDGTSSGANYYSITDVLTVADDTRQDFVIVPHDSTVNPVLNGMSVLELYAVLLEASTSGTVVAKWHHFPVPVYIPELVNINGFDYREAALAAMQRWNDRSERLLFEFVDAAPDTGIVFHYIQRTSPGAGATYHTLGADGHSLRDDIEIVNDLAISPYLTMLHEFGHTIRFGHLKDRSFIMYGGQPLPTDISDDEAAAAALYYDLPTRVDLSIYGVGF